MKSGVRGEAAARCEHALTFARAAGAFTLSHFHEGRFDVERKDDGSEVTAIDRGAESLLRERIADAFPDDGLFGEEHGEAPGTSGYRWVMDPIDGTTSFVHGVPLYGTLLALELDETPIFGVIEMPALGERIWGSPEGGAWTERAGGAPAAARVTTTTELAHATVCTTSIDYFHRAGASAQFDAVARAARTNRGWSDCYSHLLLATGRIDTVVEPGLCRWDIAASMAIVAGAGGRVTGMDGREDAGMPNAVLTNGTLHAELLALLNA